MSILHNGVFSAAAIRISSSVIDYIPYANLIGIVLHVATPLHIPLLPKSTQGSGYKVKTSMTIDMSHSTISSRVLGNPLVLQAIYT